MNESYTAPEPKKRNLFGFGRKAGQVAVAPQETLPPSETDTIRAGLSGWLEPDQVEAVVRSHDLGKILDRLETKSVDAGELYAAVGAGGASGAADSEQLVRGWVQDRLEETGGQPFIARVPSVRTGHRHVDPLEVSTRYMAVRSPESLTVNRDALAQETRRDYIDGETIFTNLDTTLGQAWSDPKIRYDGPEFSASQVDEVLARLGSYTQLTDVNFPGGSTPATA